MTQYAGLCVGGPLAGKSVSHRHQKMKVESFERPPLKAQLEASVAGEDIVPAEEQFYQWLHTGGQGLWIFQGLTLHDAINEMATAYAEKCRGRG